MVTAKLIEHETIPVELPRAAAGGAQTSKTLTLTITKEGKTTVTVSEEGKQLAEYKDVDDAGLVNAVKTLQTDPDKVPALISADKSATHGAVIHVLDLLKQNGITKFAFEIEKAT
jgi:biopolymer transport protein ExbD